MNRRNIFKLIGGAICAASIEITGIVPEIKKSASAINPAYIDATYEELLIFYSAVSAHLDWINKSPLRLENGQWNEVNKEL